MFHKTKTQAAQGRRCLLFFDNSIYQLITIICILQQIQFIYGQEEINVELGKNFTIQCTSSSNHVRWEFQGKNITNQDKRYHLSTESVNDIDENALLVDTTNAAVTTAYIHNLSIHRVKLSDEGNYTCHTTGTTDPVNPDQPNENVFFIQPIIRPKVIASSPKKIKRKIGQAVSLYCLIEAYPLEPVRNHTKWLKDEISFSFLDSSTNVTLINGTHVNVSLELTEVYKKENGTYGCVVLSPSGDELVRKEIALLVMDVPIVSIDYVKAVGANKIFLNWTLNDGNDPIQKYFVQFMQEGAPTFTYYNHVIGGKNTSYVLDNFLPNTSYLLRISAKNSIGDGIHHQYHQPVRTLEKDPVFVPKVEATGNTEATITIGWAPPPPELLDYIQYYELVVSEPGENPRIVEAAVYHQNSRNLPYMFDNLKTATDYEFKVRACSELTKQCGPWSEVVNGTTMDGVASQPTDLHVVCNISRHSSVSLEWNVPKIPNGKVISYSIKLMGIATYKMDGRLINATWGPKERRVDEPNHKTVYEGVNPNTNYSVTVSALTRRKKTGEPATAYCTMPVALPDSIGRIIWTKIKTTDDKCVLKLFMPRVSERNGPICCYRIYLVRIQDNRDLPGPELLNVSTYHDIHNPNNTRGGAYIAEMFPGEAFRSEIFLGDGRRMYQDVASQKIADDHCRKCLEGVPFRRVFHAPVVKSTTTSTPRPEEHQIPIIPELTQREQLNRAGNLTQAASKILDNKRRRRRNPKHAVGQNIQNLEESIETTTAPMPTVTLQQLVDEVFDGEIDMNSNYTGFLEVIVREEDGPPQASLPLLANSNYFETINPKTMNESSDNGDDLLLVLTIVVQIFIVLIGLLLLLLIALCVIHRYYTKSTGQGDEVISLRDSLSRALCGGRTSNHRHLIGSALAKPADIGPISKMDLPQAYRNRHKDTDYGFLREFEMLPNRFNDRTTKNSDLKENAHKNRYPDIKAYDQTRVKLSQLNGMQGSDYINSNFVIGYKERKKFICAQGPMESTISDFWRMIWEQHLEIIVMLTNLEEYNKAKCAKYWPEKVSDSKQFGDITVTFASEQRFSDFLVRNLDVFKRSASNEDEEERRQITQYHYLVWKDFMAPEHPHGIIKFIRQINSVYSVQRGPILVHCSAGVGRTGTLVALDSLIQQLEEEDQVSIFNTVCDLRHQRNFLVQSLKQYIFLYRALLDIAQYGNTEILARGLSLTIENLKIKPNDSKEKCKLEYEFEKIKAIADETNKSCSVGSGDENMNKNRSESVIPYDRNRVILTPIPTREHSTYINASFIEGYDNSESFIITQDPMENTIGDFWRMISEQSITTLVMISEIGDGPTKCPRYWADDEIQYDHTLVKYMHSESCPYYTRREFNVTNCKIDDTIKVTQFQYNGWPTVEGEVPEVCRGIIELVDQAQKHHTAENNFSTSTPIAVHCSLGTDRSSIFVAMCILVQQLRTEKKIDICTTARKLRSQRAMLLDTYAQYEFLHRAIANYADLHKLSTESPSEC
ncbi:tyrosine-protein phosphatase 69D [Episyrphus balteatus]|uniref:tyrosine-protein phosphatase 69D n=1 Tax=Episyrphus balteatus TaxID=286459 RepID=UPI0024866EBB|nr:tyrosine-protein phosphatase 69D [Episyrphus balteatus]